MVETLQEFLNANPVDDLTEEFILSPRFKKFTFKIRAMKPEEYAIFQKKATKIMKKGKTEFDSSSFAFDVVLQCTLSPNFKDVESLKATSSPTPEIYLKKVLLPGEIMELASRITTLSGFESDMEELVEEAKN